MANQEDPPFLKSVQHIQELFDVDIKTAMDSVQSTFSHFKERNQKLIERQNDQSNGAQVQLISHFALLGTLSLTVLGLLITQTKNNLTSDQELLILAILTLEIISLCFGAADYLQTISFHRNWGLLYQNIDKEVDRKLDSGQLQWTSDLNKIEAKHLKTIPESTKMWITYSMVGSCLLGLALIVFLFIAYFFNIPGIK